MRVLLLCLSLGLSLALPAVEDVSESVVALDYPEEVPGLFEGDIELQPGQNPLHRNAIADRKRRWPNGVLPYEIASSYPSAVKQIFHDAMNEIETRTKVNGKTCIHFKARSSESAYLRFDTGTGCHTPVGYIHRRSKVTIGHGCERKGTVMHEILHALGFWHEQSRPDRDQYVTIHLNNVQKGHEGNFNKYQLGYVDLLGQPYDYGSIMHYGMYSFAIDRSKPTIEPKKSGVTIGQRIRLSDVDIKEIQILYGCIAEPSSHSGSGGFVTAPPVTTRAPPSGSNVCTFEHGLCDWTQSHSDTLDWTRHAGATSSTGTGPAIGPHGSGTAHYLYTEASGHTHKVAKLDSKSFPGGDYCIEFYYHMYGSNMGTLQINAVFGSSSHKLKSWSGDHGNRWYHYRLHAAIHISGSFKFEFEGHTGGGTKSDIAIDDVTIHPGKC